MDNTQTPKPFYLMRDLGAIRAAREHAKTESEDILCLPICYNSRFRVFLSVFLDSWGYSGELELRASVFALDSTVEDSPLYDEIYTLLRTYPSLSFPLVKDIHELILDLGEILEKYTGG